MAKVSVFGGGAWGRALCFAFGEKIKQGLSQGGILIVLIKLACKKHKIAIFLSWQFVVRH